MTLRRGFIVAAAGLLTAGLTAGCGDEGDAGGGNGNGGGSFGTISGKLSMALLAKGDAAGHAGVRAEAFAVKADGSLESVTDVPGETDAEGSFSIALAESAVGRTDLVVVLGEGTATGTAVVSEAIEAGKVAAIAIDEASTVAADAFVAAVEAGTWGGDFASTASLQAMIDAETAAIVLASGAAYDDALKALGAAGVASAEAWGSALVNDAVGASSAAVEAALDAQAVALGAANATIVAGEAVSEAEKMQALASAETTAGLTAGQTALAWNATAATQLAYATHLDATAEVALQRSVTRQQAGRVSREVTIRSTVLMDDAGAAAVKAADDTLVAAVAAAKSAADIAAAKATWYASVEVEVTDALKAGATLGNLPGVDLDGTIDNLVQSLTGVAGDFASAAGSINASLDAPLGAGQEAVQAATDAYKQATDSVATSFTAAFTGLGISAEAGAAATDVLLHAGMFAELPIE